MYTIEVFEEEGVDQEQIRNDVIQRTGTAPQFHDRGTHVVAYHKLDYELLKDIKDMPTVKEAAGTYTGSDASIGARHGPSTQASRRESQNRNY